MENAKLFLILGFGHLDLLGTDYCKFNNYLFLTIFWQDNFNHLGFLSI